MMCEDEADQFPVDGVSLDCPMERAGWLRAGDGQWIIQVRSAQRFPEVPAGTMSRRVTRDLDNGQLVEDLWIDVNTPERLVKR